jgi:hypothetical protein
MVVEEEELEQYLNGMVVVEEVVGMKEDGEVDVEGDASVHGGSVFTNNRAVADGIPNRTPNDPCLGITKKIGDQQRRKCKISSRRSKELHLKCKELHQKWMKCKRADGT